METTPESVALDLAEFVDEWIDGDDPIDGRTELDGSSFTVCFESGAQLRVTVTPVEA